MAVKELQVDFNPCNIRQRNSSREALEEFQSELSVWCNLKHPCVVQFYGYTTLPTVCIVQEFIDGGDLYGLLESDKSLNYIDNTQIASDIAQGVNYLHTRTPPIMHRKSRLEAAQCTWVKLWYRRLSVTLTTECTGDLKSLNVLVASETDGRICKIADFGLSRAKETMMGDTVKMTQAGTPYWTAPEIFNDSSYNEKADVYSFAMIMYEIWARRMPWEGMAPMQVAIKVCHEKARPEILVEMEPEVQALMERCWDQEPKLRPPFVEVIAELKTMRPGIKTRQFVNTKAGDSSLVVTLEVLGAWNGATEVRLDSSLRDSGDLGELRRQLEIETGVLLCAGLRLFDVDFGEWFDIDDMSFLREWWAVHGSEKAKLEGKPALAGPR